VRESHRKLLAFVPEKQGTILDVARGKGATTRHLLKYFKPENVTGINISEKQLARCPGV
jgi:ubiquinone/menaquinone biosynthesis C-methylase UbiE